MVSEDKKKKKENNQSDDYYHMRLQEMNQLSEGVEIFEVPPAPGSNADPFYVEARPENIDIDDTGLAIIDTKSEKYGPISVRSTNEGQEVDLIHDSNKPGSLAFVHEGEDIYVIDIDEHGKAVITVNKEHPDFEALMAKESEKMIFNTPEGVMKITPQGELILASEEQQVKFGKMGEARENAWNAVKAAKECGLSSDMMSCGQDYSEPEIANFSLPAAEKEFSQDIIR